MITTKQKRLQRLPNEHAAQPAPPRRISAGLLAAGRLVLEARGDRARRPCGHARADALARVVVRVE